MSLSGIFNDYYQKELVQLDALDYFETSDSRIDQAFLSSHFKSGSYETFDFDTAAAFQDSFSIGGEKELTCDSARIVSLPDEIPDNIQALGSGEEKLFLGSYPKEMEVLLCFYTADVLTKDLGLESREDLLGSRISFESGDSCFSFSGYRISGILSNSSSSYFSYGEHTFFLNCSDLIITRNTSQFTKERLLFLKSFEDYPEFRSILGDYSVKYGGSYEAYLELTKMQAFVRLIQLCVFLPLGVCLLLLFLLSFRKFLGKEKRSAVIRLVSGYSLKKVSLSLISGILLPLILAFVLSLALDYPIALLFTALFKGMGVYGSVSSARLALSGFFLFLGILLLLGIYSIAELWKTRKRCFLRLPAEEYWLPEFDADLDGEGFSRVADKHLSLVLPDDSLYGKQTDAFFFSVPFRRKDLSVLLQTVSVIVVLKD